MMDHQLFYIALALMLIHEMDAVRCREWRIFPGLTALKEPLAFRIFLFAHIPLLIALFWGLHYASDPSALMFWLDVFFFIHVILHLAFLKHKNNEFNDWISWTFILGAGIFGSLDIILSQ